MFGTDGNHPPRGVDERYQAASNTSDLSVDGEKVGQPIDTVIAAGWSESRVGMALLRLHSEWCAARPRPFTEQHVGEHAATLPAKKGRPDTKRARGDLVDAYLSAVKDRAGKLRGREAVERLLREWACIKGHDADLVAPTLTHWLAPQCPSCGGQGKRRLPDAPVLAGSCESCRGTGERARPLGSGPMYGYIEDALNKGRQSLKRLLRRGE